MKQLTDLISVLFFLVIGVSHAWALPNCPSYQSIYWSNCVGTHTYDDGGKYVGEWQNNNMHGQGIYMWADGRKYEGEYLNDKKHGFGIYTYPDGRSYNGQWANGKQHGEGIFITPHGASRKGIWHEGKRTQWIDNED